jgi:hypothetical protein
MKIVVCLVRLRGDAARKQTLWVCDQLAAQSFHMDKAAVLICRDVDNHDMEGKGWMLL